jgi:hypothetical protein
MHAATTTTHVANTRTSATAKRSAGPETRLFLGQIAIGGSDDGSNRAKMSADTARKAVRHHRNPCVPARQREFEMPRPRLESRAVHCMRRQHECTSR